MAKELNQLNFLTESYPPYNFKEQDKLQGIAVDLLVAASAKVNSNISAESIKLQPWARAYRSTIDDVNTVLFSTTRTEEREDSFKWIGPISNTRVVVLAKKSNGIVISTASDLANHNVMAIRDDVGEQLLKAAGVPQKRIKRSSNANSIVKKLRADRVRLWVYEENVARWFLKKNNENSADYEVVHVLAESQLFYAFNKSTDDALANKLQQGIDMVKSTSASNGKTEYDNILSKYN